MFLISLDPPLFLLYVQSYASSVTGVAGGEVVGMQTAWWIYVLVFLGKLSEVSLSSLRSQLIVKGQRLAGAVIAGIEYLFWFYITATVLEAYSSDLVMILLLVFAYALGQVCGSVLEEKLALGVSMLNAFFLTREDACAASELLRSHGYAVTQFGAEGREKEERAVILLVVRRKSLKNVKSLIRSVAPSAVITLTPSVTIEGGTLAKCGT